MLVEINQFKFYCSGNLEGRREQASLRQHECIWIAILPHFPHYVSAHFNVLCYFHRASLVEVSFSLLIFIEE